MGCGHSRLRATFRSTGATAAQHAASAPFQEAASGQPARTVHEPSSNLQANPRRAAAMGTMPAPRRSGPPALHAAGTAPAASAIRPMDSQDIELIAYLLGKRATGHHFTADEFDVLRRCHQAAKQTVRALPNGRFNVASDL